ncbi:MAG: cyclic nucleotide-binding domain-containing protein [Pedosphaera sp.]|nr:cyclic nucleotide-binding domain-containing protein [Pedosphaera sp.]
MKETTTTREYLPDTKAPFALQIAEHPFLRGVSEPHLKLLTGCAMPAHFSAGTFLFREGDPANRFYLIQSGSVSIEQDGTEMARVQIGTVGPGDCLGWSWLFPPYYWHLDARAIEPLSALFFYGTRLREECEADSQLGCELMRRITMVVIQRLQSTRRALADAVAAQKK